jgi:hypothetical protein
MMISYSHNKTIKTTGSPASTKSLNINPIQRYRLWPDKFNKINVSVTICHLAVRGIAILSEASTYYFIYMLSEIK